MQLRTLVVSEGMRNERGSAYVWFEMVDEGESEDKERQQGGVHLEVGFHM